ncbi:MAG: S46 family peptidase, partial [Planctomycetes bacterium]|nr:S46 family peptidase [Planctomycetota bacterium]
PLRRFQNTAGHPALAQAVRIVRGQKDTALEAADYQVSPVQRADFIDHLERAHEWLSDDELSAFGDLEPAELADALETSRVGDAAFVEAILEGGDDAIANSDDIAITIARQLLPLMERNEAEDQAVAAIEEAQGSRIGRALFAVYGTQVSPDATLTLRFSDGIVKGYPYNGSVAPYRTTFFGLYARNTEFDNEYPFNLPQVWMDRKDRIDMNKAVDLVSTNDIIGGNSGSPLVNTDLEVVGLVFDGNIEMLPNRYVYRGDVPRSVSVHVDAIMEALKKIYDADRIVAELTSSGE